MLHGLTLPTLNAACHMLRETSHLPVATSAVVLTTRALEAVLVL